MNTLLADEFGVWIDALAMVRDADGKAVAVVAADLPPFATAGIGGLRSGAGRRWPPCCRRPRRGGPRRDRSHHRRAHRPLQPPLPARAARGADRARPRGERPLSLLFCNLDHFKQFNDERGHAATRRCARSPTCSNRRSGVSTWRHASAARSSSWCSSTPPLTAPLEVASASAAGCTRPAWHSVTMPSPSASASPRSPTTASSKRSCSTRPSGPCIWPSAAGRRHRVVAFPAAPAGDPDTPARPAPASPPAAPVGTSPVTSSRKVKPAAGGGTVPVHTQVRDRASPRSRAALEDRRRSADVQRGRPRGQVERVIGLW